MNEISDELPLCPERSPDLLGPLYVKQTGIPDLKPETEAFLQHFGDTLRSGGVTNITDLNFRLMVKNFRPLLWHTA